MCINGEEIRTGRSGVYELKNGLVQTAFFSVVTGAEENNNVVSQTMETMNAEWVAINQITDVEQRITVCAAIEVNVFLIILKLVLLIVLLWIICIEKSKRRWL